MRGFFFSCPGAFVRKYLCEAAVSFYASAKLTFRNRLKAADRVRVRHSSDNFCSEAAVLNVQAG